jgi:hypothetical protein
MTVQILLTVGLLIFNGGGGFYMNMNRVTDLLKLQSVPLHVLVQIHSRFAYILLQNILNSVRFLPPDFSYSILQTYWFSVRSICMLISYGFANFFWICFSTIIISENISFSLLYHNFRSRKDIYRLCLQDWQLKVETRNTKMKQVWSEAFVDITMMRKRDQSTVWTLNKPHTRANCSFQVRLLYTFRFRGLGIQRKTTDF